jgi:hypothetical protein
VSMPREYCRPDAPEIELGDVSSGLGQPLTWILSAAQEAIAETRGCMALLRSDQTAPSPGSCYDGMAVKVSHLHPNYSF